VTRSYGGFWAAADEQARSRVYGGIHFSFDSAAGQQIGANVGGYVMEHFLLAQDDDGDDAGAAPSGAPEFLLQAIASPHSTSPASDDGVLDRLKRLTVLGTDDENPFHH
jgi:hypothetical protein